MNWLCSLFTLLRSCSLALESQNVILLANPWTFFKKPDEVTEPGGSASSEHVVSHRANELSERYS
jgi:hypothetical protein